LTKLFDPMITIPVVRAQAYTHGCPMEPAADVAGVADLDVDHLTVDVNVVGAGLVTLATSGVNAEADPYGHEFDLMPSDARTLGRQLLAAADASEEGVVAM
jgi:hypothetical protein